MLARLPFEERLAVPRRAHHMWIETEPTGLGVRSRCTFRTSPAPSLWAMNKTPTSTEHEEILSVAKASNKIPKPRLLPAPDLTRAGAREQR